MRLVGIDIGTFSIKAVEIDSAFGRFEIRDHYEIKLIPNEPIDKSLLELVHLFKKQPDRIAIALPRNQATLRNLTIPSRDRKLIQSTVQFEIEDEMPFPLDEASYRVATIEKNRRQTRVHVEITLKKHIEELINQFTQAQLEIDWITTPTWGWQAYLDRTEEKLETPIVILNIGHSTSSIDFYLKGAPILSHEMGIGGLHINMALEKHYDLTPDQAEIAKLDNAFLLSNEGKLRADPDQITMSEIIAASLEPIIVEIRRLLLATKKDHSFTQPQLYVTGGTVLLPGLIEYLGENLRLIGRSLRALNKVSGNADTYSEKSDEIYSTALSIVLTALTKDRKRAINFRSEEFSKRSKTFNLNPENLKTPAISLISIMLCLGLSLLMQTQIFSKRVDEINGRLEKSIRSFFGYVTQSAVQTYLSSPSRLKSAVQKELNSKREFAQYFGRNPGFPLDYIKTISANIPKDVVTDLISLQIGSGRDTPFSNKSKSNVQLTFLITQPQTADRLTKLLETNLSDIKKSTLKEVPSPYGDGSRYSFTISGAVERKQP